MLRIRATALVLFSSLLAIAVVVPAPSSASAKRAALVGAIKVFDAQTLRRRGPIVGSGPGDEFGTRFRSNYVISAPGAEGGGRLVAYSGTDVLSSIGAADLSGPPVSRFGESSAYIGHPPGVTGDLVPVGAPGSDADAGILPAVVVIRRNSGRLLAEVGRVTGPADSRFGWRIQEIDQSLVDSYYTSYLVSAPLGGSRPHAGAVYKFETVTGNLLWKFEGERDGELSGYDVIPWQDVNADGAADVLVSAPGTSDRQPAGRLYVLSGADGTVLRRIEAPVDAALFGFALRSMRSLARGGVLVTAPATPRGRRAEAGAVYVYHDLESEPRVLRGRRANQWFGVSVALDSTRWFVGSFEGSSRPAKHHRGSVTAMLHGGRVLKTLRGRHAGEYFGREISAGRDVLEVGAPGAPPSLMPR